MGMLFFEILAFGYVGCARLLQKRHTDDYYEKMSDHVEMVEKPGMP